ncbi:hypothetical protein RND81_06G140700 [Saponaria officinalis]|uniref:F-box domain-containing protein n=1 Tax=Saponaria officinalis TaxID=3572 RepID=A0AAW1KBL5_SAPOF
MANNNNISNNNGGNYFPEELICDILSRLPVKSLLRFKSVSKTWRDLIQTRQFVKLHLKKSQEANSGGIISLFSDTSRCNLNFHHSENPLAVELHSPTFLDYYKSRWNELGPPNLVGSCNGLLCFALPRDVYVLYNPSTRVFKTLPKVSRRRFYGFRVYSLFAYDNVNDDYKVFELFQYNVSYRSDNVVGVESLIFSMKANSWKTIDTDVPFHKNNFVVANNCLRWVDREATVVRSFNLVTERYDEDICEIPTVISSTKGGIARMRGDFDILVAEICDITELVLWTTYCWTVFPVAACLKNRDSNPITKGEESNLVLRGSDPEDGQVSGVRIPGFSEKGGSITAKPWVESLVSLD